MADNGHSHGFPGRGWNILARCLGLALLAFNPQLSPATTLSVPRLEIRDTIAKGV